MVSSAAMSRVNLEAAAVARVYKRIALAGDNRARRWGGAPHVWGCQSQRSRAKITDRSDRGPAPVTAM